MAVANLANREAWLDNVKMVAMILVIAIHTIGHFGDMETWGYNAVAEWINSFNMQMFTLLAGYTTWHSFKKIDTIENLCSYGEKIFNRMVLPAVIFSSIPQIEKHLLFARKLWVIFAFLCVASHLTIKLYKKYPNIFVLLARLSIVSFLLISSLWLNMYWYLAMLMKLQCIGAVFFCFSNNIKVLKTTSWIHLLTFVLFLYIPTIIWMGGWTSELSPFFIVGVIIAYYCISLPKKAKTVYLSILCIVIGIALQPIVSGHSFYNTSQSLSFTEGNIIIIVARFICALCMSISVVGLIISFTKTYSLFSRMGSFSMSFYIIQQILLMYIIYPYMNYQGNDVLMWELWLFFIACFTVFIYCIIIIFTKDKYLAKFLLGK